MSFYRPNEYKYNSHWDALRQFTLAGGNRRGFADYGTGRDAALSPGYATENRYYAAQLDRANDLQMYNTGTMQHMGRRELEQCTDATNYPQACAVSLGLAPPADGTMSRYRPL
jgi:hypothetical protein